MQPGNSRCSPVWRTGPAAPSAGMFRGGHVLPGSLGRRAGGHPSASTRRSFPPLFCLFSPERGSGSLQSPLCCLPVSRGEAPAERRTQRLPRSPRAVPAGAEDTGRHQMAPLDRGREARGGTSSRTARGHGRARSCRRATAKPRTPHSEARGAVRQEAVCAAKI